MGRENNVDNKVGMIRMNLWIVMNKNMQIYISLKMMALHQHLVPKCVVRLACVNLAMFIVIRRRCPHESAICAKFERTDNVVHQRLSTTHLLLKYCAKNEFYFLFYF